MNTPNSREEEIFRTALSLPPEQREAHLQKACGSDVELRQRVECLLKAHDPAGGQGGSGTIRVAPPPDEPLGKKIGPYKLREKIGEGGCGIVYVAEQEQPVRRRVALKVIKLGMDTKSVIARFEAERQALALMDHPNIAKVLDAGSTETGRPYFVMELVRGIKITDYCDQNKLSPAERLELFIQVCHAIQHAHQKGLIHRDIKPSNILVTLHDSVPVPKVIDFGIAKATEGRLTDLTVYTELYQFIGTPAYMSPEQAEMSGLDIDTRSDIYSLGVLLYELLTGRTPFDAQELAQSGLDGMRRIIREVEPVKPSTRLTRELVAAPRKSAADPGGEQGGALPRRRHGQIQELIHLLRGDLDWIVMKCLEKDRTRRYETANGLAMDLQRHLSNEPVVARPPSAAYRFQKLVRRNRLAFAAAGAVTATLVIGLGISVFMYIKENQAYKRALAANQEAEVARASERRQREQADAARSQAEGLVTFMMHDLQPALTRYGRLPLLKQVGEKAIEYFDGLPPDLRDLKTEFGRADSTEAMGEILRASGDLKGAEAALHKAHALYQHIAEQYPDIPEAQAAALLVQGDLGFLYAANSSISLTEQDANQQAGLRKWHELYSRYPTNALVQRGLLRMLLGRAEVASYLFNKPQDAIAAGLEAESMLQVLAAANPENKDLSAALAQSKTALATAYEAMGQRDKSVQLSEEAAVYFARALKEDPGNLILLAQAADVEKFLSYRVSPVSQKRARDAELVARERYRTLSELDPSNVDWRYNFAMTHMMECYYLESEGQIEQARQALKKFDALLQPVSARPLDREKLMANSIELARLAVMAGDVADAHAQIAIGESRFQDHYDKLPAGSFDRVQARIRWLYAESRAYLGMHDWTELARVSREGMSAIEDGLGLRPDDSELLLQRAVAQGYLGIALLRQGNAREAVPWLQQSVTGYRDTRAVAAFKEDREGFALEATKALAEALTLTGDARQARSLFETALATSESRLAKQPDSWELKEAVASSSVQFAAVLDPANVEDAARRRSLLDRAAGILNSADVAGRLTADDRELKATIESLRAVASRP